MDLILSTDYVYQGGLAGRISPKAVFKKLFFPVIRNPWEIWSFQESQAAVLAARRCCSIPEHFTVLLSFP